MDQTELLLQEITDAHGVPGYEDGARAIMAKYLQKFSEVSYDKLGSVVGRKIGSAPSPRVLIGGHLDEVGFMVKEITKEGFLKFLPLGGWWGHVALGQRVLVNTSKGPILGVVGSKPPHILQAKEREKVLEISDMFVDIGAMDKFDAAKKFGVRIGDPIVPDSRFTIMNNQKLYMAKAFDNRIACAAIIDILRHLQKTAHPNTVFGVGSVQEEVGSRGARTAAYAIDPDIAIVVDVGIALDSPPGDFTKAERLGGGPAVLVYDAGMIPNQRLRQLVIKTAEENKIPFHLTSMERGATDGAEIHKSRTGVPSIALGIPTRYIHSHNSIIYRGDYDNTVKLVVALVKKLNKKAVESLSAV